MNHEDQKEYLDEREGIRIYSGNQPEFMAIKGAKEDLKNYIARKNRIPEVKKMAKNPFNELKEMFEGKRTL